MRARPQLLELPLPDRLLVDPDDPEVTLTIRRDDRQIRVETRAGDRALDTVVEYAFGTSDRNVTMIGRDDDRVYRGVRLSHDRAANGSGWDRTSGDAGSSDPHENVRGRPIDVRRHSSRAATGRGV